MKYQVLARKYRPKTFSTMIGQEHVLKALSNALESERLHHAYLFTGTRGVGKTTVARVLAKALNCEQGISAMPCGECPACQEIDQGRFVDLIEVDAASRTKVEDTRELLDNVQYAPTRGRFKIYLIDEVHMLSGHSFNALLKTLEEPPPHVKFLLATTDPQKLPVTILSRCLQFNLKRLTIEQIERQLHQILNAENIKFQDNVLKPLAIAADGSMRDALSLLDQSIAYCNGSPNLADIEAMLGSVQKDRIFELITALANEDGGMLIEQTRILAGQGIDVNTILAELITVLQRIALCQKVPDAIDDSLGDKEAIAQLAQVLAPEDIQLYYQIAINGRKDLPYSPQPQGGFEMILLRMLAFKPEGFANQQKIESPKIQQAPVQLPESQTPGFPDTELPTEVQPVSSRQPNAIVTEKKTADLATTTVSTMELSQQNKKPDRPAIDKGLAPVKEQSKANDSFPEGIDLPPVGAYGQENFIEPSRQDMMPLFEVDVPLAGESQPQLQNKQPLPQINQSQPKNKPLQSSEQDRTQVKAKQNTATTHQTNIPCNKKAVGELADFWHDLINRAKVSGLEQQLAKHCALTNKSEQKGEQIFELLLESVHKHLCSDKIKKRLIDALQHTLGSTLKLDIKECLTPEEQLNTPRRREIHEAEVLQQQAMDSIFTDPKVKMLVDAFTATIRKETIKPV